MMVSAREPQTCMLSHRKARALTFCHILTGQVGAEGQVQPTTLRAAAPCSLALAPARGWASAVSPVLCDTEETLCGLRVWGRPMCQAVSTIPGSAKSPWGTSHTACDLCAGPAGLEDCL